MKVTPTDHSASCLSSWLRLMLIGRNELLPYKSPGRMEIRYDALQKRIWRMNLMNLEQIQAGLQSEGLDGWLFYDFRKSNPIAYQVLSISLDSFFSRRWFYFVPASGTPTARVSAVESHVLRSF